MNISSEEAEQKITEMKGSTELGSYENQPISLKKFFQFFGPGLLISMAYLDPGNLYGDLKAGKDGRYGLLWILLLSTAFGYMFQSLAARVGVVTGYDMATLCRATFSNSMLRWFLWIMCEIAIMGSDIQEVLGTAIALRILFGLPIWAGVLITILDTLLILLRQVFGVRKIEALFAVLITVIFLCFFVNLILIQPEFKGILMGIFVPSLPSSALGATVGLIGSIIMPHNLYLHSALVLSRNVEKQNKSKVNEALTYFYLESGISLLISFFINLTVICTFAHFSGVEMEIDLLNAGDSLSAVFGKSGKYIWAVGLLAAGQCSTISGTMAGQYVMQGFINVKVGNWMRSLIIRSIAIFPSIMLAFFDNPTDFNESLNILQAIQLPFAVVPLLKLAKNRKIMNGYHIENRTLYFLSAVAISLVSLNIYQQVPETNSQYGWMKITLFIFLVFCYLYLIYRVMAHELDITTYFKQESVLQEDLEEHTQMASCDMKNNPKVNSPSQYDKLN